jgi:acyl-CoA thioesterase
VPAVGDADRMSDASGGAASPFFTRQMQLVSDTSRPGRWCVDVDAEWNCPIVPHGGLVTAVAARAMELELDRPDQELRSISVVFAEQVPPGPVEVDVTVLRRGRTMSQATATVRSVGREAGHTSIAVFGSDRPAFEFTDLRVPDFASMPRPEDCPSFRDERPEGAERPFEFPFWEHVEGRPVDGHAPWDTEWLPTSSEVSRWYRIDETPLGPDGAWDPLALVMLCDTMPSAVGERMGPAPLLPPWLPPSCDLTVHLFGPCHAEWVYARNHARHAGDGYASADLELWDPTTGNLVAYGTQVMFFRFLEDAPTEPLRPLGSDT